MAEDQFEKDKKLNQTLLKPIPIPPSEERIAISSDAKSTQMLTNGNNKEDNEGFLESKQLSINKKEIAANLSLKTSNYVTPFLITTSNGSKYVVVVNTAEGQTESKSTKEALNNDAIMVRNKDVFLPQIIDEPCDESIEAEFTDNDVNKSLDREADRYMLQTDKRDSKKMPHTSSYQGNNEQSQYQHHGMVSSSNTEHHQTSMLSQSAISNSFTYNENGMYSQATSVPAYMDTAGHHVPHGAGMYQAYQGQGNQQMQGLPQGVGVNPQAIGVAQQAYLTPGQAAHQRVPISHTTRASPATVQWLLENYETAEGVSLPRSTLYNHYLRHCAENKIDAVNAASFGKLIRSVFLGLKTRRLGTRGNSKYHYYGIRVKPDSPLARLTDDTQVAMRQQPNPQKSRFKIANRFEDDQPYDGQANAHTPGSERSAVSQQMQHHQQYLGDIAAGLPELPDVEIDESQEAYDLKFKMDNNITDDDISDFAMLYRDHCEAVLQVIVSLQFSLVEAIWQTFWKSPAADANKTDTSYEVVADRLSKETLIALTNYKPVQEFIKESDYILYQRLVEVLVPDVLRAVPSGLTQMIRNFAKSLENWLISSMSEMPSTIINLKVAAVSAFSQTLRRYTSLNHLAQAARAVLQNPSQINQMWTDLNKVDFTNVQEQASWVCQCDESLVLKLEEDFKQTLAEQHSLEQWAEWLERVVNDVLESHRGQESYPKAAREFLLKWSFYSSMIIRDLTLRSAASFGSFHLIRLLYDEYMFYLVEHKVADATGKSPLAVMAEFVGLGHFLGMGSLTSKFDTEMQSVSFLDDSVLKNGINSDVSFKRESPDDLDQRDIKRSRDS